MRKGLVVALSLGCLTLGMGIGYAAKEKPPGMDAIRGKAPKDAAMSALAVAEQFAGEDTWQLIAIARVYYLSGDKAKGQAIIDHVSALKGAKGNDWQRIGRIYVEAKENAKAEEFFNKTLAYDAKDDSGRAEIGAWYIRNGNREKGEQLLTEAFARHSDDPYHYIRAAEGFLGVPEGR
jgi:tetratricopeptide (TPR) repeat protein